MSRPRFHCTPLDPQPGATAVLVDAEARHARQILRLRPGDEVEVFVFERAHQRLLRSDRPIDVGVEVIGERLDRVIVDQRPQFEVVRPRLSGLQDDQLT